MNSNSKYVVRLTGEEREQLEKLVKTGKVAASIRCRAHVLLKADAGLEGSGPTDQQVSEAGARRPRPTDDQAQQRPPRSETVNTEKPASRP